MLSLSLHQVIWRLGSAQKEIPKHQIETCLRQFAIHQNQHLKITLNTLSEAKTVAMRVAITFKHASPFRVFSSSQKSSSKALSLSVTKP